MTNNKDNQLETNFQLTGYSNSRLGAHILCMSIPKISFDRFTIVGNLDTEHTDELIRTLEYDPNIRTWDVLQTRFKGMAFENKVYIEYDSVKAKSWNTRNMRVEFNPNQLSDEEKDWLRLNIIGHMRNTDFTRIDVAFDFEEDLSKFYAMSMKSLKKTVIYGRNGTPETKYFGVRDSDRFIRIYNKKQERKDNADIEINSEHLWRVEIELKRDMVLKWNDCFHDLHILMPAWKTIQSNSDKAMVFMLLNNEDEWGSIHRNSRAKYKKMIREISPVDLTENMKNALLNQEKMLAKTLKFWVYNFRYSD